MKAIVDSAGAIRRQSIEGEMIVMREGICSMFVQSTLDRGVLELSAPKMASSIVMSTIKDSVVHAATPQRNSNFFLARFINCKFRGVFAGIDFGRGHRVELNETFGDVRVCDFSDAILDGCRFVNVSTSEIKFPSEDHRVLSKPSVVAKSIAHQSLPPKLDEYLNNYSILPDSFTTLVVHIPRLARLIGSDVNSIREAMQTISLEVERE